MRSRVNPMMATLRSFWSGLRRAIIARVKPGIRTAGFALLAAPIFVPTPLLAIDLTLPGNARLTFEAATNPDSYALPIGAHNGDTIATRDTTGRVTKQAWRIDAQGITTLQLLTPLREQLDLAGFKILFECRAQACGGFDFRFGTYVVPAPDMHVDLFDYRVLSAEHKSGDTVQYLSLLISHTANAGYVQIVQTTPTNAKAPKISTSQNVTAKPINPVTPSTPNTTQNPLSLVARLESTGHATLSDLTFKTGSSDLGDDTFATLDKLAQYLRATPSRKIALVGHTDTVGSLSGNIALSKRRAASVLERLASRYDIPRAQMTAEGMGYLSPITTNLTLEGRKINRRVEAILLNTE